jgi:5'-nucleotidase
MEFHYSISDKAFGLSNEELTELAEPEVVCTSCRDVLEEYLSAHQNLTRHVEGRLVLKAA